MKHDYFFLDNLYTKNEITDLIEAFKKNVAKDMEDVPAQNVIKTSEVSLTFYGAVRDHLEKLNQAVIYANKFYFYFDLFPVCDSDRILLNQYKSTNEARYDWHNDGIPSEHFDYKLTVLLNLSESLYTGGVFEFFINGDSYPINEFSAPGSVLIFPSFRYHRVTPVTYGVRNTITLFYTGPLFR